MSALFYRRAFLKIMISEISPQINRIVFTYNQKLNAIDRAYVLDDIKRLEEYKKAYLEMRNKIEELLN